MTLSPLDRPRRRVPRWLAYAAALWAFVFAIFHIVWAAGWYPLLGAQARIAFATRWWWWYDVVVAAMCVIAIPVALAPVTSWGRRVPWRLVYSLALVGTTLLVLRSLASLTQVAFLLIRGRFRPSPMAIWEPWFYFGAVLFSLSTLRSRQMRLAGGAQSSQQEG